MRRGMPKDVSMMSSNEELRRMAAKHLASRLLQAGAGARSASRDRSENETAPRVCVVHGRQTARKIVSKALESKLEVPVHRYGACEDALRYTKYYDTFVVYNNFGKRMNGAEGVARIRAISPEAFIVGVTSVPNFRQKFSAAGADATVLMSGNEVAELAKRIERYHMSERGRGGDR